MTGTAQTSRVVALRTVGQTLVEFPFVVVAGATPWAASIWPDPGAAGGWGREIWTYDRIRRGWTIPPSCTYGTVVELGAAPRSRRRRRTGTHAAWYGVALVHDLHWLICTTPFSHPNDAHAHSRRLLDGHRHGVIARYDSGDLRMRPEPHSRS